MKTSLLMTLLPLPAAAAATIVDLSTSLVRSGAANSSQGADVIQGVGAWDPFLRIAMVLEHGQIVAEYVREDVDPTEPFPVWSTTKSWMSLFVGRVIESGGLSLETTLLDVWPNHEDTVWSHLLQAPHNLTEEDVDFRKNVTIYDLLTMSSGLVAVFDPNNADNDSNLDGGSVGGANLVDSIGDPVLGEKGVFSYLGTNNILSYVLLEVA